MKHMNEDPGKRRSFLKNLITLPVIASVGAVASAQNVVRNTKPGPSVKLSLNAYSFNKQLLDGTITIDDMLEFCAANGLMAVDITGYYFKGYPNIPADDVIYKVKRKAFGLGLEICGTGVRNDFTHPDPDKRRENVRLVKDWVDVSQKLGGQTLRIFSGTQKPSGYTRAQIFNWMIDDIRECVDYAKTRGVVIALQNHDDFLKTAEETIEVMEAVKSPWLGLMLDIGSFRSADAYEEIARTIKYAVTWQIKEKVFSNGREVDVDANKLIALIRSSGFRGYLPLETLGEGDPKVKIPALLAKFQKALDKV